MSRMIGGRKVNAVWALSPSPEARASSSVNRRVVRIAALEADDIDGTRAGRVVRAVARGRDPLEDRLTGLNGHDAGTDDQRGGNAQDFTARQRRDAR